MSMENDITKKIASLEENKDFAGLEEVKNDAEASFDGETVGLAEQAIARLNTRVEEITPTVETTENQKTQVENLGGTESSLQEVTAPVDEKIAEKDAEIKNVEKETEQKISEVKVENLSQETNETKDTKKDFYNIEKPKTPEEIEKYRQTLQARFKELPEEYKSSVEDIMKVLDNPEALEIAANSFGVDTKNYPDQNVRFQRTQELFKGMDEMPIQGNVYNPINRVFQSLSEKYPEKKSSFTKMQSLMKEHADILTENNLYKQAQAVYNDPKKIENLFTYSKTGGTFDEPNMNLENGWSNASAGKKLVELGVLTEEDLQKKLNNFLKQAEDNDPYLVNMKRFPKEYEERVSKFKKEFGIV